MTVKFSTHRYALADQLESLLSSLQQRLDSEGETNVNAYDLLLEVTVKFALPHQNRSDLAYALSKYGDMVAGDLLSNAMAIDEMPDLE